MEGRPMAGPWAATAAGQRANKKRRRLQSPAAWCDGVPERTRTSDLRLRRPALYPLSYGHLKCSITAG
jgi:hypothetical protein